MLTLTAALALVHSVVISPMVAGYNIGITCNPQSRRQSYRGVGYEHFAIIDFGLSSSEALALEKDLYDKLTSNKLDVSYEKYRQNAKGTAHRPSLGGKSSSNTLEYCVYVAWWNVGSRGYGWWKNET